MVLVVSRRSEEDGDRGSDDHLSETNSTGTKSRDKGRLTTGISEGLDGNVVPGPVFKQGPESSSKPPRKETNYASILSSGWLLSNTHLEVPTDASRAIPSATAALIILAHLERLASGYLNLEYAFKLSERNNLNQGRTPTTHFVPTDFDPSDGSVGYHKHIAKEADLAGVMMDWSNVQLSGAISHQKWMYAEKNAHRPYCVDARFTSLQLLYRLVEDFSQEDPSSTEDLLMPEDIASDDAILPWVKDPCKLLFRRCVVRLCLGLMKVNLHFLLRFRTPQSSDSTAKLSTPLTGHVSSDGVGQSERHSIVSKLHTLLQDLVKIKVRPSSNPASSSGSTSELSMSALSIQHEAAEVLKVGFELFYPTSSAKQTLLLQLTQWEPQLQGMLMSALASRLSTDCVMAPLIVQIFTAHVTHEDSHPKLGIDDAGTGSLSSDTLAHILHTLLKRSHQHVEHAVHSILHNAKGHVFETSDDGFAAEVPKGPAGKAVNEDDVTAKSLLQLLSGLQKHVMWHWCSAHILGAGPWSSVVIKYSQKLLEYSFQMVERTLRECKEGVSSETLSALSHKLKESFFALLLPPLLCSLSMAPPSSYLVVQMVPPLMKLAATIDALNMQIYALQHTTSDETKEHLQDKDAGRNAPLDRKSVV